jgi:glycerol-3-phosphate dehydrogenase
LSTFYDVIVLGSGCAGLSLALELARSGYSTAVLDSSPFAKYASTRNQGWIHSGSLYAGLDQPLVADHCVQGNAALRSLCGRAISDDVPAYYVFQDPNECAVFERRIRACHIHVDVVDLPDALIDLPIIERSPRVTNVLRVHDRPFNTSEVLSALQTAASDAGTDFYATDDNVVPLVKRPRAPRREWAVEWGTTHCTGRAVVLAAGALIPATLSALRSRLAKEFFVQKIEVLTVHKDLCRAIVATPVDDGAPNLVPFNVGGVSGTTICLTKDDQPVNSHTDKRPRARSLRRFPRKLMEWYPSLDIADGETVQADLYCCQKLQRHPPTSPGTTKPLSAFQRGHFVVDHGGNGETALNGLFTFYPGKFTASPVVAKECAATVTRLLKSPTRTSAPHSPRPQAVAQQRFLTAGTYTFERQGKSYILRY